ncbi:MAG: zeta toxin family protein [Chlamydiae bacterium]|nr:zeta toxin family protein [Chlamydiota bacterium]
MSTNPKSDEPPIFKTTAGAPGAGKTKILGEVQKDTGFPYLCYDNVGLKNMRIYNKKIEHSDGSKEAHLQIYNYCRPGANAFTEILKAHFIKQQISVLFDSTSTSPHIGTFFDFLKKQGYRIEIIYVAAPDDVRWESIKKRDKEFVQTTEQDIVEKGKLLPQRIPDYLKYADKIDLYYRGKVDNPAVLTATWEKTMLFQKKGKLQIIDQQHYENVKKIHNEAIKVLNKPELSWENTVEANSVIFDQQLKEPQVWFSSDFEMMHPH